jgi:TonB-dependent starch-binding outer membrane protein SusC
MKKIYENYGCLKKGNLLKTFLVMKFTFLMIFLTTIQSFGTVYSQNTKLSVVKQNATLVEILEEIESQSEFRFLYNNDLLENKNLGKVRFTEKTVDEILEIVLKGTGSKYSVLENNLIVISPDRAILQQNSVSGQVMDEFGQSLPGVTIVVKGTTNGTITDVDGNYLLSNVPENATLVFSFVGMKPQEIAVGNQSTIDVVLEQETIGIEEVVAIGYGTQQRREVSGSISNISEKDFNKGLTQNAVDLLKGKVAGLSITMGSGDVTRGQTIRLRGTSSLTGSSQPFIVIDGVPGMNLSSVAPHDIESISVLKDASAAAIYGSRSASGVILVTTKSGKYDQSMVEYDGYVAMSTVTNVPDVLTSNEWRDYASANNINTEGLDRGANTDWFDAIMRTGVSQNHNISLSGGGKNSNYRASISYLNQQGVMKDNQMERYNARLTFTQKALNDMLNITFTGAMTMNDNSPTDTRNFVLAYNMIPVAPIKNDDGTWFDTQEYDQGNPVRNQEYNSRLNKYSLYFGNLNATLNLFEGFTAGIRLHKERATNDYGLYYNSETERGRNDQGYAQRTNWTSDKQLLETTLNYEKWFDDHKITLLGGYSYEDYYYQNSGVQNRQFVTDFFDYNNLQAGENLRPSDVWSGKNMNKLVSFFGRASYNYLMKYIFTVSLRICYEIS